MRIDMEGYITIKQGSHFEYEDRKSVFIGEAYPVSNERDAISFIESVKKRYPDARHHVYAYVLRENSTMRFTDDHEPQGTAGMPVLDVIRKNGCTDVVGSRVANSLSSDKTPAPVKAFSSVDLPALV